MASHNNDMSRAILAGGAAPCLLHQKIVNIDECVMIHFLLSLMKTLVSDEVSESNQPHPQLHVHVPRIHNTCTLYIYVVTGTIDTIDYVTGIGNYSRDVHYARISTRA